MVAYPSLTTAIFAAGWLSLVKAGYSGVLPSQLAELFPTPVRGIGVSLSFSITVTIFGGFTPFVSTWLIAMTGNSLSPSFYIMFTAALSIIALVFVQRRRYPREYSDQPRGRQRPTKRQLADKHQRKSCPAARRRGRCSASGRTTAPARHCGERARWRLPLGRHT